MSHHTCTSEMKAQNTSGALSLILLNVLHPHPLHGRAKAQAVLYLPMAVLALPAEASAKVLLFAFACQPDLPNALSQPDDISSLVSSFAHQSSSQSCFMMCCKTTMLSWVFSVWLPHLSLLSLHTGTSSITASLELGVRTESILLSQPRVVWTLISRSLCPQAFFFFPGNVTTSYI